ncbi:hypothetical protein NPIL_327671 [Nephila pilipes]|uniref:Uncharacterized protein n=1 Tax=Nephila pilipes TaxID=299642 RepID=A0A8X6QMW6_NEPPI|nr:hypothetical protein NPIL_327671 [Nephila pilipes]
MEEFKSKYEIIKDLRKEWGRGEKEEPQRQVDKLKISAVWIPEDAEIPPAVKRESDSSQWMVSPKDLSPHFLPTIMTG